VCPQPAAAIKAKYRLAPAEFHGSRQGGIATTAVPSQQRFT
jgi:hypothetical protein